MIRHSGCCIKKNWVAAAPHINPYVRGSLRVVPLLILISSFPAYAFEKPGKIGEPVWVEATGEAYMGEMEMKVELKERAKKDAERKAIEIATGTFVKSHTLVSNYQLAEDLIYTAVRGEIDKEKIIKEWWDEKDRNLYKVHIKALIKPVYPEKGEGLKIELTLSKTDLKEGEEVKIFYQANNDCFVYIFSVAADGSVTLLLPNSINKDNSVKAGKTYEFPPEGSNIRLQAQFLPGYEKELAEEKIKIIATKQKEELLHLSFKEGLFKVYDAKSTGMISDLQKNIGKIDITSWAEETAVYILRR